MSAYGILVGLGVAFLALLMFSLLLMVEPEITGALGVDLSQDPVGKYIQIAWRNFFLIILFGAGIYIIASAMRREPDYA